MFQLGHVGQFERNIVGFVIEIDQRTIERWFNTDAGFAAGVPAPMFNTHIALSTVVSQYTPAADGQRFLVIAQEGDAALTPLTVVLHWNAEMKRR